MNELWILTSAETVRRLRSRVFVIATLAGLAGVVLTMILPTLIDARPGKNAAVIIGPSDLAVTAKHLIEKGETITAILPPGTAVSEELLTSHKVSEAIVLERSKTGRLHVTVYARDISSVPKRPYGNALLPLNAAVVRGGPTSDELRYEDYPIDVRGVGTRYTTRDASVAASGIGFAFTFLLYVAVIVQSTSIMSAVVEEKVSRIAEILVSIVNPANLLIAKIVSSGIAALVQVLIWLSVALVAAVLLLGNIAKTAKGPDAADAAVLSAALSSSSSMTLHAVLWFFIWFLVGFLQCSLLISGVAALVTRTEEMQSVTLPVVLPVAGAFIVATIALNDPNARVAVITSYLPLFAPFVMFARSIVGQVPLWQQLASLGINVVALWFFAVGGGKLYRAGMLSSGGAPSLRQFVAIMRA